MKQGKAGNRAINNPAAASAARRWNGKRRHGTRMGWRGRDEGSLQARGWQRDLHLRVSQSPPKPAGRNTPGTQPGADSRRRRITETNTTADALKTSANTITAIKRKRTKTIVFHSAGAGKATLRATESQPNKPDPKWDLWLRQAHSQPTQTGKDEMHFSQILRFNSFP